MRLISDYKSEKYWRITLKKIVLIVMVLFVLGGTAAFADHPGGLGIGVMGGYGIGGGNGALSLKLPDLPLYLGLQARFGSIFGVSASGDYYIIDDTLLSEGALDLGWYFGVGGYVGIGIGNNYFDFDLGLRIPVGLTLQILPFEVFIQAVPTLGVGFGGGNLFRWDVGGQGGIRIWL
jgi:hypothetical protein